MDRSGARAPTPSSPSSLLLQKPVSPSSNHSGKNPPAGVDADLSDEGQMPRRAPSLIYGFPSGGAEGNNLEAEGEADAELDTDEEQQLLMGSHEELSFSRVGSPCDGNESDNSFQSATEEVDGLEGAQRMGRSFSVLQKDVHGMADASASREAASSLRSFPISTAEASC